MKKTIITAVLIISVISIGSVSVHALSVSHQATNKSTITVTGNTHRPQTLTTTFQQADNPVITANPQPQGNETQALQPTVSPQR